MKCPKCDYIGFETGDRCKNCGYDFSLLAEPPQLDPDDLTLTPPATEAPVGELWLDPEPSFPLFPSSVGDDEPLIKLAEPRAPLAVRRTPDQPRLRSTLKSPRKGDADLALQFAEEMEPAPVTEVSEPTESPVAQTTAPDLGEPVVAGLGRRMIAAVIDHAILVSVDIVVIYCTVRMTALTMSEWRALPPLPLLGFLGLLKLAYFSAFTAMGGQTIGKMAAGIRVVADDHLALDPPRAIRRTLTGAVSLLSLGLGLIPVLFGPERRALHDRVAHTRVVELPSA
jgi:uncharacterized RDD family membrane protein YckC